MTDVDHAATTVATDGEMLVRSARAEVARLSLAVRAARHEAELREREAADLDSKARDAEALLRESLRELIEDRRRERDEDLAREHAAAERVVGDARQEAAWLAASTRATVRANAAREGDDREEMRRGAAADEDRPEPPLRLRVVGADDLADPVGHPAMAPDEPSPVEEPEDELAPASAYQQLAVRPSPEAGSESTLAVVAPDELRALVQAAVVAGLREAMEQAMATIHLVPTMARQIAPAPRLVQGSVAEPVDEPPFLRRLLYLDVLLPFVAALIVIVLTIAWIG